MKSLIQAVSSTLLLFAKESRQEETLAIVPSIFKSERGEIILIKENPYVFPTAGLLASKKA